MLRAISLILLPLLLAVPAAAQSGGDFYAGKQITIICGSDVGGAYDAYARLVAAHIGNHIAGHPSVIVQNMPGAGTLLATNYVANVAAKDGTIIGAVNPQIVAEPLVHPETAKFDPRKLAWLGSPLRETQTVSVWHTAPVQKFADLFDKELLVAGTGGATTTFPLLLNGVLGTKFKVVKGYAGTAAGLLAIERGEVQGLGGDTYASLKGTHGDLLRDGKLKIIAHYGLQPLADLPQVPSVMSFAKTDDQRAALTLVLSRQEIGRPYVTAGGVPPERVALLRAAFAATMQDPAFRDDAGKRTLELEPVAGADIAQLVDKTFAASPAVVAQVKAILGNNF
jgi:tripartite-type tricarboxylate transporter receptor subunit TctC